MYVHIYRRICVHTCSGVHIVKFTFVISPAAAVAALLSLRPARIVNFIQYCFSDSRAPSRHIRPLDWDGICMRVYVYRQTHVRVCMIRLYVYIWMEGRQIQERLRLVHLPRHGHVRALDRRHRGELIIPW